MNKIVEENENKISFNNKNLIFNNIYYFKLFKEVNKKNIENFFICLNNFNKIKINYFYKFIIAILFLINFLYTYNRKDIFCFTQSNENEIIKKTKQISYLKNEFVIKFNYYIKMCNESNIIDIKNYSYLNKPKISVIIPIFQGGKYLNYSLNSIVNQKMKEIEIILIDDHSTDNSLIIIDKFMKMDNRIRLIKNNKNRKILYSKSIAALNANGKYLIELDQDDIFVRNDLFNILYFEASSNNLDLVQIRDFLKYNLFLDKKTRVNSKILHWIKYKKNHYKKQPELKDNLFYDNNNYLLWGILINTTLYRNSIYNLWPLIMNYQIVYNEDYIITCMITKFAQKYKYINVFGIIHLIHSKSAGYKLEKNYEYHLSNLFFVYYLYEYYFKYDPHNIKIIINYINFYIESFNYCIDLFPNLFYDIISKILKYDYLLNYDKIKLIKKFNNKNFDINKLSKMNQQNLMNESECFSIINFQNNIINNNKTIIKNNVNNFSYSLLNNYIKNKNKVNDKGKNTYKILKNNLLVNKKYKITIIIYCNEFKFLEKTIYSIIYQINYCYEIIIIYDNDDKFEFEQIKLFSDIYENIKIINNNHKGLLHSYSIGVLKSNGEYILILQSGYTLSKQNILSELYNYATNNKIDILEFNLLINKDFILNNNSFSLYRCLHYKSKINFKILKKNKNYKEMDQKRELLFNKLIKKNIYKNIIYKYELNKFESSIYNHYEDIILFLLNKNNALFKHIDINGLIKNNNFLEHLKLKNIMNNKSQKITDSIFYINFIFDNSNNTFNEKKYVLNEYINLLNLIYNKYIPINNDSNKLFKKFLECEYINEEDKIELKFFYNSLIN